MVERMTPEFLKKFAQSVNATENPVTYLGIDPGVSNGVCGYDKRYYLLFMLTVHAEDMVQFLAIFDHISKCIIESYRIYPHMAKQHIYSDLETPRVIGRVEHWAESKKVDLIKQPATVKKTGYKWIGQKPPSKSDPQNHVMDGHVHFMYWAIKHGKIDAREILKRTFERNN